MYCITPFVPSTITGKCPRCGGDVPLSGRHECDGVTVFHHTLFPKSRDDEILAELKEIRNLLEVIVAEII